MAVIGISLIVASVVWVIVRPPGWVPAWFTKWTAVLRQGTVSGRPDATTSSNRPSQSGTAPKDEKKAPEIKLASGGESMPLPPTPTIQPPIEDDEKTDLQTTPKALATNPAQPVPSFSLQDDEGKKQPAVAPSLAPPSSMMPPPPRPPTLAAPGRLPAFPAINSAQRARGPLPNRNPLASSGSGLAPPPTHSSKPSKPSRKVILTPGHSPLDWARISGPTADLRGVPSSSPYLRVTPSMLKKQTGRKGTDAWMGLNGKVYNISPYADYHPGGVPELMRGAGKDGTKLFGEIHPWVNYETMLSACLVGLMVEEPEGNGESEMDKMD